ncbi:MAG TPA: hypothetical protein VE263_22290 [Candidatus Angelobacter sp.]|nr:hypothetical protein [Candidatus Angelobacter sp.]
MVEKPIRCPVWKRQFSLRRHSLIFLSAAALLLSGCGARKRPNIPWATAVQVKPVLQASAAAPNQAAEQAAPELMPEMPPFAAMLLPVRSGPARPRSALSSPAPGSDADKMVAPVIAPQLSAQETAAAQQETSQSLSIAEKNLTGTRGKVLNASQSDLVSKINGFLKDAREAAQTGDWSRARGLAKKAQVLSEELASSF